MADPYGPPELFDRIACCYDGMNRLLSLGRDRHWRELAAEALHLPRGGCVLDVGSGTGDMALAVTKRWPGATVVAVDPTKRMIAVGRMKADGGRVTWTEGDGLRLPFADAHFDGAVSAFMLRNVVNGSDRRPVATALAEQCRVIRPGGRLVCLELSWPQTPVFRQLFSVYFTALMPSVAGAISGQPAAYRYLPRSVQRFVTPRQLTEMMRAVGLRNVNCRRLALGTVTLHVGERPDDGRGNRYG